MQDSDEGAGQDPRAEIVRILSDLPPEKVQGVADATINVLAEDPAAIAARADANRRNKGMWIGGGLATASLLAAIGVVALGGSGLFAIALLCFSAACVGGTFAVVTGKSVGADDFANMFARIAESLGLSKRSKSPGSEEDQE